MKTHKKLDRLALRYLKNLDLNRLEPFETTGKDTSITLVPKDESAFTLNPCTTGAIKLVESIGKNNGAAVCTILVGYSLALRIAESPELFNFHFSSQLNILLSTMKKHMGNLSFRDISVIRPNGDIFAELENSAAYELRMFIKPVSNKND